MVELFQRKESLSAGVTLTFDLNVCCGRTNEAHLLLGASLQEQPLQVLLYSACVPDVLSELQRQQSLKA